MEEFICIYCDQTYQDFESIILHNIEAHKTDTLKIQIRSTNSVSSEKMTYSKDFKIIPQQIEDEQRAVFVNNNTKSIRISRQNSIAMSPLKKVSKSSTPMKDIHQCDRNIDIEEEVLVTEDDLSAYFDDMEVLDKSSGTQTEPSIVIPLAETSESDAAIIQILVDKMPAVLQYLNSENQVDMYIKFNKLLAEQKLPLSNIAFLLFVDVVEWFSLDTTRSMRYNDDVKKFWGVGLKLFKGKFLRFMSGWKNKGQVIHGDFKPEHSVINFAVPARSCLQDSVLAEKLKESRPGVLEDMIQLIRADDENQTKTYKLCVDGKKINYGIRNQRAGDIDLWGHEGPPSLADMKTRFDSETILVNQFMVLLENLDERGVYDFCESFLGDKKYELIEHGKKIITVLSHRIKDLRLVKQSKVITLERIKSACCNEALKSKYTYALSAIKTYIYQINACIKRILKAIDSLGYFVAVCNDEGSLYETGGTCDLSSRKNYICLTGPQSIVSTCIEDSVNYSVVKQRSDLWHEIRNSAKVTGSTCHAAVGLSGLKKQKEHFEFFVNKIEKPQISEEVNKRLKHGSENEINAVATLVSKVLPVYQPKSVFREEGCETVVHNDRVLIVVSPDGSVRKTDDNGDDAITAVEIKCPYPGKIFTTPVYYEIPWYYVCQVILEMHVLRTETLFFICYTEESTTVFEIYFDRDLWQDINECIVNTYGSCDLQIMKKLPPQTANLKEKVKRFCKENVTFIAEIPSVKVSKVCAHQAVSGNFNEIGYNLHGETSDAKNVGNIKCTVSDMITNIHDTRDAVAEAYSLCRQLANEVLVFLISDLDRIHKREQQYSVPVAYAFKGYSLQCSVMRQMIIDVIRKCFDVGLYIPALSFDGQWAKIAVRSKCDAPLTVLQLQKDVFKEAKATTRADIMGILKSSNVVKAETFTEFNEQVQYQLESNELNKSHVYVLYRAKACEHMFKTSIAVKKLMSAKDVSKERGNTNTAEMLEEESSGHNDIRSTLPPEIAESLDDGIISAMDSLRVDSNQRSKPENQELFNIGELFESGRAYEPEPMEMDSSGHSVGHNINNSQDREDMDTSTGNLSDNIFGSVLQDTRKDSQGYSPNILLSESDKCDMLHSLSVDPKIKSDKWNAINEFHFNEMILTKEKIMVSFTKHELATCLRTVSARLKELNVSFSISWKKEKLVDFFYKLLTLPIERFDQVRKSRVKSYKVQSLKTICANTLNKCSKHVLSCIYAEYLFPIRLLEWQKLSPFSTPTRIQGLPEAINWYSMPEYEDESYTYMFHMLDCHHLFVNARVKCCSTGITERGIKRQAWIKVAEKSSENGSGLSLAIVEDLVDKQSNAFAQKTFSIKVEQVMRENGDIKEAEFCKVIREWYAAEDDPGIDVMERIKRR